MDLATALIELGQVCLCAQDYAEAERWLQESLEILRGLPDHLITGRVLSKLGLAASRRGDLALAEQHLRESLTLLAPSGNLMSVTEGLEALAELRLLQEQPEAAALLRAYAASVRDRIGAPLWPVDRLRWAQQGLFLRKSLGEEKFDACARQGCTMTQEQALAYALQEPE